MLKILEDLLNSKVNLFIMESKLANK